jgi:mannosyltransferase
VSRPGVLGARTGANGLLIGGLLLVLLAGAVGSGQWVSLLLDAPPPDLEAPLMLGAGLFRVSLFLLGAFLLVGVFSGLLVDRQGPERVSRRLFDRADVIGLALILCLALALRLINLNSDLWIDEIATLTEQGRASFGEILATYGSQNHHFLYSLLAKVSLGVFGESAAALRLPAVLFGVGSVGALYLLARAVSDRLDAILSAALLTVSYHHVWFSQNARGYSAVLFGSLLGTWIFLRALKSPGARRWMAYGVVAALGVYSHQTMVFVVLAHFLIYAWRAVREKTYLTRGGWQALYAGFVLFGLLTFSLHALTLPQILGPALADLSEVGMWKSVAWTVREMVEGLRAGGGGMLGVLLASAVFIAGCVSFWSRSAELVLTLFLSTVLGAAAVAVVGHPLWPRFFFFAVGFAVLVVVRGARASGEGVARRLRAAERVQSRAGVVLAAMVILVAATSLRWAYLPKQDYTGARDYVTAERRSGDTVVAVGLARYAYGDLYAPDWQTAETFEEFDRIRRTSAETWVVYTMPVHMEAYHPEILAALRADFDLMRAFPGTLNGGTVFVYRSRMGRASGGDPGRVDAGGAVSHEPQPAAMRAELD